MDSSSALINLIHVLQMLETVDTATRNLSAKSFSNSPSLSLMDTNVNSSHNVSSSLSLAYVYLDQSLVLT